MEKKTYNVVFNDEKDSNDKGMKATLEEAKTDIYIVTGKQIGRAHV